MARLPDWRTRLARGIGERRNAPFDWGAVDCGLVSADLVKAMTGEDPAAPLRGYRTRFGALRALKRAGANSIVDYLDARFERTQRPRAGDFVAFQCDDPLASVMIADGRGGAWGQIATGLVRTAIPPGALYWSV
jgi:hypothetical protein